MSPFSKKNTIFKPSRHPLDEKTQLACGYKAAQFKGATTVFSPVKEFVQGLIDAGKLKSAWMLSVREILSILIFQYRFTPDSQTGVHCKNVKRDKDGKFYVMYACSYAEWTDRTGLQRGTLKSIFDKLTELRIIQTKSCKSYLNQHSGKKTLHMRPDREVLNYLLERIQNPIFHSAPPDCHPAFVGEPDSIRQRLEWTVQKARERSEESKWEQLHKTVDKLDKDERGAFENACEKATSAIFELYASDSAYCAYLLSAGIIKKQSKRMPKPEEAITSLMERYLKGQDIPKVTDTFRKLLTPDSTP